MTVKIICCLAMICSCSFAGGLWTSSKKDEGVLVAEVMAGRRILDYNMAFAHGIEVWKDTYVWADVLSLHFVSDQTDSTNRVSCLNIIVPTGFFLPILFSRSENLTRFWIAIEMALNPTIEYYLWRNKLFGLSVSAGYKFDWFLFSPGQALYFKPHADFNVDVSMLRLSASYAYLVTDTYSVSHGHYFYVKVGLFFL